MKFVERALNQVWITLLLASSILLYVVDLPLFTVTTYSSLIKTPEDIFWKFSHNFDYKDICLYLYQSYYYFSLISVYWQYHDDDILKVMVPDHFCMLQQRYGMIYVMIILELNSVAIFMCILKTIVNSFSQPHSSFVIVYTITLYCLYLCFYFFHCVVLSVS